MILENMFESQYLKLIIVIILALVLTFAHEIKVIHEPWLLLLIGIITLFLLINNVVNMGIIFMMVALVLIVYNIQIVNKDNTRQ